MQTLVYYNLYSYTATRTCTRISVNAVAVEFTLSRSLLCEKLTVIFSCTEAVHEKIHKSTYCTVYFRNCLPVYSSKCMGFVAYFIDYLLMLISPDLFVPDLLLNLMQDGMNQVPVTNPLHSLLSSACADNECNLPGVFRVVVGL